MAAIPKSILIALAVIAVGASQILGLARGFLCDCSGHEMITDGSDCDAAQCHEHGDHHDDEGTDSHGEPAGPQHHERDSHQHRQLKDTLVSTSFAPLTLMLPPDAGIDLGPDFALEARRSALAAEQRAELKPPETPGFPPPSGVLVARTVVLLI